MRLIRSWPVIVLLALIGCGPAEQESAGDAPINVPLRVGSRPAPSAPGGISCASPRQHRTPENRRTGVRFVAVYFACEAPEAIPGQLYPANRPVSTTADPVEAALRELVRGPSREERDRGYRSLFSPQTAGVLRAVSRSARGDTITVDFAGISERIPDVPGAKSFLPPGIMAEITWTVFGQFPEVQALRFRLDGRERAFWKWLGGEPRPFTRRDWEQV